MTDFDALKAQIVHLKASRMPLISSQGAYGYTSLSEPEKALCDVLVAIVEALEAHVFDELLYRMDRRGL